MTDRPKKRRIFLEYAWDSKHNVNVVPEGTVLTGDDGLTEIYNRARHHGHMVCPACETPVTHEKAVLAAGGDRLRRKARLRSLAAHDPYCSILEEYLEGRYPSQHRTINPHKGPYFYLNAGDPRTTRLDVADESFLPRGVRRIEYGTSDHHNYRVVTTPDFHDRPRMMSVNGPVSLQRLWKQLPEDKRDDAWMVHNEVAVNLKRIFSSVSCDRLRLNLYEQMGGVRHPLFLIFDVARRDCTLKRDAQNGDRLRVNLPPYHIPNPDWRPRGGGLALPESTVKPYIHIRVPEILKCVMEGGKFLALVHPYFFRNDGVNGHYGQHFDVKRVQDIAQMEQTEDGLVLHDFTMEARPTRQSRKKRGAGDDLNQGLQAAAP